MIIRKTRLIAVAGLALMLTFMLAGGAVAAKPESASGLRWIVQFEDEVNWLAKQRILDNAGGVTEMHLEALDMAIVFLPSQAAARGVEKERGILRVEEDSYRYYDFEPLPWGIDRIDAEEVWPSNTGDGVNVAVLDTGIDTDHPDLAKNLEGRYSAVNRDTSNVEDRNGHGTHCSGIIAALNNGIGVVGVGPDIDLYAVQISRGTRIKLTDILEGINWCVGTLGGDPSDDIQVMSMSYGGGYSEAEDIALQTAYEAGIVLVSSAGNASGGAVSYPAALDQVIAVSATDKSDVIASFSSTGVEVELAAPGVSIYSTYLSGSYATMSGTSMAGPHVAGVAALYIASNPGLTPEQVRLALQLTAEDLGTTGKDNLYGSGLVDAENAVLGTTNGNNLGIDTTAPVISSVAESDITASSATITWTTDEASDSLVRYGTAIPPTSEASDATMVTSHSVSLTGLTADTTYYYEVQSTDGSGNTAVDNNGGAYYSFTTEAAPPTGTMYVANIEMSLDTKIAGRNTFYWAIATVTVIGADEPIEGVTVEGHWEVATTDSDSGTTDANGQVSLQSDSVRNPPGGTIFTFVVDSVTKDGWTYDPEANAETSGEITVS